MDENIPHLEATLRMTEAPGFLASWMSRFYDAADVQLIRLAAEGRLSSETIGGWNASKGDTAAVVRSACKRGVIDLGPDGRYTVADFHRRFEMWALFEGWKDIPPEIRVRLNAWEMDHYAAGHADQVAALRGGGPIDAARIWPRYLLLHEAEALLGRVGAVFLWPCNCRAMMKGCGKPDLTCLRFSNDRGLGWEISRERAREIARSAHKNGLMQVGEIGIGPDGEITGALCNCCADCCYPQQLSIRLGRNTLAASQVCGGSPAGPVHGMRQVRQTLPLRAVRGERLQKEPCNPIQCAGLPGLRPLRLSLPGGGHPDGPPAVLMPVSSGSAAIPTSGSPNDYFLPEILFISAALEERPTHCAA